MVKLTNDEMFAIAKSYAAKIMDVETEKVYIVWFSKTLQNFKALCSTEAVGGKYVELTYNGDSDELYVDYYEKLANVAFSKPWTVVRPVK